MAKAFGHGGAGTAAPVLPGPFWVARCRGSSWHRVVGWDGGIAGLGRPLVHYAGNRRASPFPLNGVVEVTCEEALWERAVTSIATGA